jgi:AcrR family transcriptional regulator
MMQRSATKTQAPTKKLGLESGAPRAAIVRATEQLIREQGFATITSRIIAAKAGVKPPLIHYYFSSMDDLYVEVFRLGAEADFLLMSAILETDHPLREMWRLSCDPNATRFVTEFMAIANHNVPVRAEISRYAKKRRELQAEAVSRHLALRGVTPPISPIVIAVLVENVARGLVLESALDISLGHDEVEAFLDACLRDLEASVQAPLNDDNQSTPKRGGRRRSKPAGVRAPERSLQT